MNLWHQLQRHRSSWAYIGQTTQPGRDCMPHKCQRDETALAQAFWQSARKKIAATTFKFLVNILLRWTFTLHPNESKENLLWKMRDKLVAVSSFSFISSGIVDCESRPCWVSSSVQSDAARCVDQDRIDVENYSGQAGHFLLVQKAFRPGLFSAWSRTMRGTSYFAYSLFGDGILSWTVLHEWWSGGVCVDQMIASNGWKRALRLSRPLAIWLVARLRWWMNTVHKCSGRVWEY